MGRPTVAEIDLSAIVCNFRQIRKLVGPNVKICPAVKADAYGHGAVQVSRTVVAEGAEMLGVATIEEAAELREAGIDVPILIFGVLFDGQIPEIVQWDITPMVCTSYFAEELSSQAISSGKRVKVHIKVDTGMGRVGIRPEEAVEFALSVSKLPGLEIEGIFSHFPCADDDDRTFSHKQIVEFKQVIEALEAQGINIPIRHLASSAAILGMPESHFNMVRPGIMLYGLHDFDLPKGVELRQAMTLRTKIAFLKEVVPGTSIGYGRTFLAHRVTRVATLPIGYADGYSRMLSNRGIALVRGKRARVIGRVCMDQIMLDVTDVPEAVVGDDVVLYGSQGEESVQIMEVAALAGTITYEIACAVSKRVPRAWES